MDEARAARAIERLHAALKADEKGDAATAGRLAGEAVAEFDAAGDATGGAAARQLLAGHVPVDHARVLLDEVVAARGTTGDHQGAASALEDLVRLGLEAGDEEAVERDLRRLLAVHHTAGRREAEAEVLRQLAQIALERGDVDSAEKMCSEAAWKLDRPVDAPARAAVQALQAGLARVRGDLVRARSIAEQAIASARAAGSRAVVVEAQHELGLVAAASGDWPLARRVLIEALDGRVVLGDAAGKATTWEALAHVEAGLGHLADAFDAWNAAAAAWDEAGVPRAAVAAWHALAALADERGRADVALAAGDTVLGRLVPGDPELAPARFEQGVRRAKAGDFAGAARELRDAVDLQGAPDEEEGRAVARAMLGQVLAALGDVAGARTELTLARDALAGLDPDAAAQLDAILGDLR